MSSYTVSNYGGRQANTTAFIKQFIGGSDDASLWTIIPFNPPAPDPPIPDPDPLPDINPPSTVSVLVPAQPLISNLYIPGNIYLDGAVINASDACLKHNIISLSSTNIVSRLLAVKSRQYQFVEPNSTSPTSPASPAPATRTSYGMIAQEVEPLFPDVVHTLPNGCKSIDYISFIPMLIETVQQQQSQIAELTDRLNTLLATSLTK